MKKNFLEIYTDGACKGNPGPGGWGALLLWNDHQKKLSGFEADTTNNRMELRAAIEALKAVKKPIPIKLHTDSTYVRSGITEWIKKWQANGWNKGKIKNIDLWEELYELTKQFEIEWIWVKGHSGHKYNDIVDQLASDAAENRGK
jgi:ribonuclease HI